MSCRACGGQPVGLLGQLVEPRSVPAIFDVDAGRPGLQHGRHRSRDILITGLDVRGHRHVERRDDPRDDRYGTFRAQAGVLRYAERPGHAGAGGGDRHRCRPYRVAGPVTTGAPKLVCEAVQQIIGGVVDDGGTEATLAARIGLSARHLRRLFLAHLGVSPDQLARSRRAHFARRLLDDTDLTVLDIAFAAGFGSLRQFNRTMREVFRASPTDLRNRRHRADRLAADGGLTLLLPVVPGYDWDAMRAFLAARLVPGVEAVDGDTYRRTITMAGAPGLLEVSPGRENCLLLRVHLSYWEGLIHVVDRVGLLLGVECDYSAGVAALSGDPVLGPLVAKHPGLAEAGAWNPFEVGVSAILCRDSLLEAFVARLGTPVPGLQEGLTYAFPDPARVTSASLAPIGLGPAEASAIAALAAGREIPEVSDYVAFRLGQRDAFPSADPSLQAALAHLGLRAPAANWRPWLALAAAHLMAYGDTLVRDAELV